MHATALRRMHALYNARKCYASTVELRHTPRNTLIRKEGACQLLRFRQELLNFHMKSVHELNLTSFVATTAES